MANDGRSFESVATMTKELLTSAPELSNKIVGDNSSPEVDAVWIILSTFIIFTMHSGFAMLESGFVQKKNEVNVLVKNTLTVVLSGASFWLIGYGFAYGESTGTNAMSGIGSFVFKADVENDAHYYAKYFMQLPFAITSTHIVSGAVSERINLKAFLVYCFINTGFIYVFPAHWMWSSSGWLSEMGAFDFAGSAVVHMCGGAAAFSGALLLGPREGKYGEKKKEFVMNSPANVILGTFLLWWGWIGFNSGSTFGVNASLWKLASRTAVVTMNGGIAGGIASLVIAIVDSIKMQRFYIDVGMLVSGVLGGLVGITAIASICHPWEAMIIGFIGGFAANGVIALLEYFKIDDPVGAVGVHWGAGLWSMIAVGLFAEVDEVASLVTRNGVFKGGDGYLLGVNVLAALVITAWSAGLSAILFLLLHFTIGLRASKEEELIGFDEVEHGIKGNKNEANDQQQLDTTSHTTEDVKYERKLLKTSTEDNAIDIHVVEEP